MHNVDLLTVVGVVLCAFLAAPPANGQEANTDNPKSCPMDQVFYQSLYDFSLCDVSNAYTRLDRAIDELNPSESWELYLSLYRNCFDICMGQSRPVTELTAKGKDALNVLESKSAKSAADLVKIWVIKRTDEPLAALVADHAESPWAEWAKWKLVMSRVQTESAQMRESFGATPYASHAMLQDAMIGQLQNTKRDLSRSIMRKWLLQKLCSSGQLQSSRALECYNVATNLIPGSAEDMQSAAKVVVRLFENLRPTDLKLEWDLLNVFAGGYAYNHEAVVWKYFERQRAAGVQLPACIPKVKEEFLDRAKGLNRLASIGWE
jgi:hypothetical protein